MDRETLRKVQLVQLDIAKEVKRVCEENGIKYFLDSGTLLGAVRHRGFIPWDDDLDMAMLRDEYDRFCRIAPGKFRPEYFLQTWETDPEYPYGFAKVRKLGTVYIEASSQRSEAHHEIYIDLYPYDHFPDEARDIRRQARGILTWKHAMWMKGGLTPWKAWDEPGRRFKSWMACVPLRGIAALHSRDDMIRRFDRAMRLYNDKETMRLYEQTGGTVYGKWVISASCVDDYVSLQFEDDVFACPRDWDLYLKQIYGEYMRLPPENQRENKHRIIEVKV